MRRFIAGAIPLAAASADAVVLMQVKIDALDITVLSGGGESVGRWATEHGFRLPPDAPEVLDFYAARSPIFMAAIFDADAAKAKGQQIGDGTPVHITIPTANPWVPLRILATGKKADARVDADVYLLTDRKPLLLPAPFANGMELQYSQTASASLLNDLRSDKGMDWVPEMAWLTKIGINAAASQLTYDLAISANGTVAARACASAQAATPTQVGIRIHYSRFEPSTIEVPAGVPITFTIVNDDPIDHEWLIGDSNFHNRHRSRARRSPRRGLAASDVGQTHDAHVPAGDVSLHLSLPGA